MRKNYIIGALTGFVLALGSYTAASAQAITDVFGKYKFTADMTVTTEGQAYASQFSNDCEVTINSSSSAYYKADITGLAGGTNEALSVSSYADNQLTVLNWNGYTSNWGDGTTIWMSNAEGLNPWSQNFNENGGNIVFTYDASTKTVTMPDFTLVSVSDYNAETATVLATFKNVKMTLTESIVVDMFDFSGDWHVVPGGGQYDSFADSVAQVPGEFDMTVAAGEDAKSYYVTLNFEGLNEVTLPATSDGKTLTIQYDSTYFDSEKTIAITALYSNTKTGTIEFSSASDTRLALQNTFAIKKFDVEPDTTIVTTMQYWSNSVAKKDAVTEDVDFGGVYQLEGTYYDVKNNVASVPFSFTFALQYNETTAKYYVTEFDGGDAYSFNYGGIPTTVSADSKNILLIDAGKFTGNGGYPDYEVLYDATGGTTSPIALTVNADGTCSFGSFFVYNLNYNTYESTPSKYYDQTNFTITRIKDSSAISAVEASKTTVTVDGSDIVISGEPQYVEVFNAAGQKEFAGVAQKVNGLTSGLHIVKVGDAAVKAIVK